MVEVILPKFGHPSGSLSGAGHKPRQVGQVKRSVAALTGREAVRLAGSSRQVRSIVPVRGA